MSPRVVLRRALACLVGLAAAPTARASSDAAADADAWRLDFSEQGPHDVSVARVAILRAPPANPTDGGVPTTGGEPGEVAVYFPTSPTRTARERGGEKLACVLFAHPTHGYRFEVRPAHWFPYDRVGGVNADP
jgi:hypothetical protein